MRSAQAHLQSAMYKRSDRLAPAYPAHRYGNCRDGLDINYNKPLKLRDPPRADELQNNHLFERQLLQPGYRVRF